MIRLVSPEALKKSAIVASKVHLVGVEVVELHAGSTNPGRAPDPPWRLDFDDSVGEPKRRDQRYVEVPITFRAKGTSVDRDDGEFVNVSVVIHVRYEILEGAEITKRDLRSFADLNALYNAWPHARAAIQDLSVRIGYPPMIMPLLTIRPSPERTAKRGQTRRTSDQES